MLDSYDIYDVMGLGLLAYMLFLLFVIFMFTAFKLQRKLDRYRLKYGFDKELESKDTKQDRLDKIEKRFKRRVYKD